MAFGENQGIKILLDKSSIAQSKSEFAKLLKEFQGEATKGVSVEFNDAKLKAGIETSTTSVKNLIDMYKSFGDVSVDSKIFNKDAQELESFRVKILDTDKILTELRYKNNGDGFGLQNNGIKETDQAVKYAMEEAKIRQQSALENQKLIDDRIKKEQDYNDVWQKLLKNREISEKASYEKLAVAKLEYQKKLEAMNNNSILDSSYLNKGANTIGNMNVSNSTSSQAFIKEMEKSERAIMKLQAEMTKYQKQYDGLKAKYGNLVPKAESEQFVTVMDKMQSEVEELKKGTSTMNATGLKSLGTEAGKLNSEMTNIAKNSGLKMATQDSIGLGNALQGAFQKALMFAGIGSIMYSMSNQFKKGITDVIEMDTALTNLSKVVDMSSEQLDGMRESAVGMGVEMGRNATEVANAQAEMGRLYKDAYTINKMTESAIIGANVMDGATPDEVAKGLSTVITSMKLQTSDAMTIIDSMNEVQNNYRISSESMLESLSKVGSSAYTAGASLQELEGYITAVTVATGADGGEVGNAIKSLISRVYRIGKDGIEDAGKSEIMLNSIGVAVRDASGQFLKIDTILKDLNGKWKDLNDTQKIAVGQTVGGIQQYDKFLGLMNNFDMAMASTNTAMNSNGSAIKENEKHVESIEGKMATLKATMQGFWTDLISSNTVKAVVDGMTNIVTVMGDLDTQTVITGISFVIAIKSMIAIWKSYNAVMRTGETVGIIQKIILAMLKHTATVKVNAVAMGASAVATTGLGAGFKILTASIMASVKASLAFLATPLGMTLGTIALALGVATVAFARNAKEQKLFDERVKANKESVDGLTESLKTLNSEGVEENSKPLLAQQSALQAELVNRKKIIAEIEALKLKGVQSTQSVPNYTSGNNNQSTGTNYTSGSANISEDTKKLQELESQLANTTKTIDGMNTEFKESGIIVDELTGRFEILTEAQEKMVIPNATKQYEDMKVALNDVEQLLGRINELQELTPDLVSELLTKYPEMEGHLGSVASAQEFLNNKQHEQSEIQREAYEIMMGDDEEYFNSKFKNNEEWMASVRQSLVNMGISQEEANKFDLNSFKSLNDMKNGVLNQFGSGIENFLSNFVGINLQGYGIDVSNFKSAGEAKLAILSALNQEVIKVTQNMANAGAMASLATQQKTLIGHSSLGVKGKLDDYVLETSNAQINQYKKELSSLENGIKQVNGSLGNFGGNFSGFTPNSSVNTGGSGGVAMSGGDSGSDKDSTAKKEAKAKEDVADIESKTDKYLNFNDALSRVNGELTRLSQLQEHANDKDKIKYMEDEIRVLDQKKKALEDIYNQQRLDSGELNTLLSSQGILNGDGTIDNDQLEYLRNIANASTGDEKKARQEIYTQAIENVKKYSQLRHKDMVDSLNDIADIGNQQISIQKKIADIIKADIEEAKDAKIKAINEEKEKQLKIINEELDARVKAINEAKEKQLKALSDIKNKYNKENELDDFNENMAKEQSALAELNASRMNALKDDSALGKAMLRDIDNQIKAKREEIAKLQLDQSRKEENEKLDEESEKVSEDNDSKIKEIEDGTAEAIKKLEATAEGMLKQLDIDAETLGSSLDRNLVEKFKSTNTEIDMMISKFKDIGLTDLPSLASMSMVSDQGRAVMSNSRGISANTSGLEKSINNLVSSSNQSPITFSMPITVNGKPTDAEYKEIESKFGDILNKGIKAFEEKLYQRDLKYGLA